jgi:hypothetical protein
MTLANPIVRWMLGLRVKSFLNSVLGVLKNELGSNHKQPQSDERSALHT